MSARAEILLADEDDFNVVVGPLKSVPSTGTKAPIIDGTVTGFLAQSKTATATADAALEGSLVYVGENSDGDGGTYQAGEWLFRLDASVLTNARLAPLFAANRPWLIITRSNDLRRAFPVTYVGTRQGPVES